MEELIDVFNQIDGEDYEQIVIRPPKQRRIRPRVNHFDVWDEEEFFKRFRLRKDTAT